MDSYILIDMPEIDVSRKIGIVKSEILSLTPSPALGACTTDAQTAIHHLTSVAKICNSGTVLRVTPRDVDSPTGMVLIFAAQMGGYTTVPYHDVALMDGQIVVDLGALPANKVMTMDNYYSFLTRLQR